MKIQWKVRKKKIVKKKKKSEKERSENKGTEEEGSEKENHTFEPRIETEYELLPEDLIDLDAMNTYFALINTADSDGNQSNNRSDFPLSISPFYPFDYNLQALSPKMQSLKFNPGSFREVVKSSNTFRPYIHTNQLHANEPSIRQYDKQRGVKIFVIGYKVSIAVPVLDCASTDDKRIFGQVIQSFDNAYSI